MEESLEVFLTQVIKPQCTTKSSQNFIERIQQESTDNLLSLIEAKNHPNEALDYLYIVYILKVEDSSERLGIIHTTKAVDCFFFICQAHRLAPNNYMIHLNSFLVRELLAEEDISNIFTIGKLYLRLKNEGISAEIIGNALDISYSACIFEIAPKTDKESIIQGLSSLIKAKTLELDSTGAADAIVENAFSWIEENEDFYSIRSNSGQRVEPDRMSTQIILGLLEKIGSADESFQIRLDEMQNKYGLIKAIDHYSEANEYDNESQNIQSAPAEGEITSLNEIEIIGDVFKMNQNETKTITTRLFYGKIKRSKVEICIKKITAADKSNLTKFAQEVNIMRELSGKHPCFLKFYGSILEQNDLFIIMEYVKDSLHDVLRQGTLTELQKIEIAKILIDGFAYMSQKRIYHRDIKPQNILLTPAKDPKIIDFGITVFDFAAAEISPTHLVPGAQFVQGTLGYMSPEQKITFTHYMKTKQIIKYGLLKSDVFSLGITFFQMAVGEDVSKYEEKINNEELKVKVKNLQSVKLKEIIILMIDSDPEKRLNFIDIQSKIRGETMTVIN